MCVSCVKAGRESTLQLVYNSRFVLCAQKKSGILQQFTRNEQEYLFHSLVLLKVPVTLTHWKTVPLKPFNNHSHYSGEEGEGEGDGEGADVGCYLFYGGEKSTETNRLINIRSLTQQVCDRSSVSGFLFTSLLFKTQTGSLG